MPLSADMQPAAAGERKFFKHTITVTVLREDAPLAIDSLADVAYAITEGDCVGTVNDGHEQITTKQAAEELIKAGSDPGFFQLDEEGNDLSNQ